MSPERTEAQQGAGSARSGKPGAILAAERQAQGLSIDQVAEQLKLAPRQIVALENDQYSSLPGMAIVRGFVRAYAKHLRLDAAPLVAMIEVDNGLVAEPSPLRREMATPFAETRMPSMSRRNMTPFWVVGSVIVLAVILVLVGMQFAGGKFAGALPTLSKLEASASAAASEAASAVAGTGAEKGSTTSPAPLVAPDGTLTLPADASGNNAAAPATTTAPAAAAEATAANANNVNNSHALNPNGPASPVVAPVVTQAAPAIVPTAPGIAPPQAGQRAAVAAAALATAAPAVGHPQANGANNMLVLKMRQDSWVEVKRVNGPVLMSRLLKAGSSEMIDMSDPVQLVVGNVNGVDAVLRGAPLTLKSGSGNTARVNLK